VSVTGDGGDGGQVYVGMTESEGQGQGVIDVGAYVGIEDDATAQGS
jgi:hypothetical protein